MTAATSGLDALRRPFRLGIVACFAAIVCVGGIVAAYGTPADRAAGVAERWLVAVGDTTRDGLTDDAVDRALEYGDPALAAALIPALAVEDDERAFTDLRVGRDVDPAPDLARIPYELTPYEGDLTTGWVDLVDGEDGWTVVAVQVDAPEALVQFDVERPARAAWGFWVGALLLGTVICAGCTYAVWRAGPALPSASQLGG